MTNRTRTLQLLALGVASAVLAGCASPGYSCKLNTPESAKCASVEQAYSATQDSMRRPGSQVAAQSVFDPSMHQAPQANQTAEPVVGARASGLPDESDRGMPVFKQPKVMRVWIAPYVDANGNLRSGEYTYFSTPGEWNYGTMHKAGAASGMFGPSRPNDYGFTPDLNGASKGVAVKPQGKPSAPGESLQVPSVQGAKAQPSTVQGSGSSITQPYERLAN